MIRNEEQSPVVTAIMIRVHSAVKQAVFLGGSPIDLTPVWPARLHGPTPSRCLRIAVTIEEKRFFIRGLTMSSVAIVPYIIETEADLIRSLGMAET